MIETRRIIFRENPHIALINAVDYDPVLHEDIDWQADPMAAIRFIRGNGGLPEALANVPLPRNENGLLKCGPTLEEYVAAGYAADNYPPVGYAEIPSDGLTRFRTTGKLTVDVPGAGDLGSAEAHNLGTPGSTPGPATTPDVVVPDPAPEPELVLAAPTAEPTPTPSGDSRKKKGGR